MLKHTLKQIISDGNMARLQYICNGMVHYNIEVEDSIYQLVVDSTDYEWKSTYIYAEFKAITLMRWIRKGWDTERFQQIK